VFFNERQKNVIWLCCAIGAVFVLAVGWWFDRLLAQEIEEGSNVQFNTKGR